MIFVRTFTTASRVLLQLRHDPRTVGLILVVPCVLIALLKYIFNDQPGVFERLGPMVVGIFPLVIMFLVTSIATLRERTNGTLDRLLTQPISKFDFIFGYALAFALVGLVQAILASSILLGALALDVAGGALPLIVSAVLAAFLGTALGLFVSAFASSEFQAVELVMPSLMPQVLLCGLFVPRDQMPEVLEKISNVLPLSYSVDAMQQISQYSGWGSDLLRDLVVVAASGMLALVLGSLTIRRKE